MKIDGNAVRQGNVIELEGRLWLVVEAIHTKPGKGGAYMQVELKGLQDKVKLNRRFRSDEKVEQVRLEELPYQYLFSEGDQFTLMDTQTYDQITLSLDMLGPSAPFLQEGMQLMVCRHEQDIVSAKLPDSVIMEVVEADPVVKGQTATSSYKPAMLENGVRILVPPYITSGTKVVVNTQTQEYVERAK
jgi:elongation factor P